MILDLFLSVTPKEWKESIEFPDAELYARPFEKKIIKKINYSRGSPDPENSRCGHQQPYSFFSGFYQFPDTFR